MNLTKKQIEIIRENTPQELKGSQQSIMVTLGYYQPKNANWCYDAGYIEFKGCEILIVTRFGQVM